jgi:hypothetical protein
MVPIANASVAQSEMRHAALRMIGLRAFEDISDTSQCLDQRLTADRVDFASQSVNVNIDHVRVWLNPHAPDLLQKHGTSYNSTGVPTEVLKKHELLRTQV